MENASLRKLIDLKQPVYYALSKEAASRSVPLKRHIETLLEEHAQRLSNTKKAYSSSINRLIGSAKPKGIEISAIDDDRLQYLLSK